MKTKKIKSALPIYIAAAVWLILGLITPMYKLGFIILAAAISAGVWFAATKLIPDREVEYMPKADTGDKTVDMQIEEGRAALKRLRDANAAIPSEAISKELDRMDKAGGKIFDELERNTGKANQVRKFMNYYLPTADKLLISYRAMQETGSTGENVTAAITSIENSLGMIAEAFEKQLDSLYKNETLDVQSDIDVMETMLSAEGVGNKKMEI